MLGTGVGTLTIPANTVTAGKHYRVTARGRYSTSGTNPAQMNWRVKLGSVTICSTGNTGLGTGKTDKEFELHADLTVRTTGSTGTMMGTGMWFTEDNSGSNAMDNGLGTTATVDWTVNQTFDFTVDFNDGSVGNNEDIYTLVFEEVN
jgi:hypothetical protein